MTRPAASLEKSWAGAFLRRAALPQHMAERLCLSEAASVNFFEATPQIGGIAANQIKELAR